VEAVLLPLDDRVLERKEILAVILRTAFDGGVHALC